MICANCARSIRNAPEVGTSGLYFPNGFDIDLCIDCYWDEEELVESSGSNDHPERLAKYLETLGYRREAERVVRAAREGGRL